MKKESKNKITTIQYSENDVTEALQTVALLNIPESIKAILVHSLKTVQSINSLLQKNRSLRKLIGRFFGFKSESSSKTKGDNPKDQASDKKDGKIKGHGRKGYSELEGAEVINHSHPFLKNGDKCPEEFCEGKVYIMANPGVYVRIMARNPIVTTVNLIEKLRCNLCGKIFEEVPTLIKNAPKYDDTVYAHLIMAKCFYGMAHKRTSIYGGIPASTQAELFAEADHLLGKIFDVLCESLINDYLVSFDDTKMKIQAETKDGSCHAWASAFVSSTVVVYFIDRDHAGIVLAKLLEKRSPELPAILALSDALPSYEKYKEGTVDLHCNVHGRRRFINAASDDEAFALEMKALISKIYKNDDFCKEMNQDDRMKYHRENSGPIYNLIIDKIQNALEEKKFLPNSEMGKAVEYWSESINKLTAIVRIPGVILDTNHVEQAVKAPIRIRKHAPIFKTLEGAARVGRMLSLVESARKTGVRPFEYLLWAIEGRRKNTSPQQLTPLMFKKHLERPPQPPP